MASKSRSPVAFGPYIITRRIARGGMAEIYRARTRMGHLGQDSSWVAVKMMRPALGHEDLRERLFQREARIASKLLHDNVVPVYEYGQEMERPYIAMEYVRGRDLSHLLKNEKKGRDVLDFELGLYIGFQAAAGLGYAQRLVDEESGLKLEIVHRDMSPGNVMVGYDGSIKVLDFGVARMNETQGVHTQTGTLRGKFAYMSPEQTLGEELDARSDVFSLGTVLYELLTGTNCFRAQNPIATLERVQGLRPVPPSRSNRKIPKTVDRILARCLAKDKKRRFKDCAQLQETIGEFLDKRKYDGRAALVEHMAAEFSWENHEEEQELAREEEEVALFDVVDFAHLSEVGALDARNLKVSKDDRASQAEVIRGKIATDDEDVFEPVETGARPAPRPPTRNTPPPERRTQETPVVPTVGLEEDDEKTIAQPAALFADEAQLKGELSASSLLDTGPDDGPETEALDKPPPELMAVVRGQPLSPAASSSSAPAPVAPSSFSSGMGASADFSRPQIDTADLLDAPKSTGAQGISPPAKNGHSAGPAPAFSVTAELATVETAKPGPLARPGVSAKHDPITKPDIQPTAEAPKPPASEKPLYQRPPVIAAAVAIGVLLVALIVTAGTSGSGEDERKPSTRVLPPFKIPIPSENVEDPKKPKVATPTKRHPPLRRFTPPPTRKNNGDKKTVRSVRHRPKRPRRRTPSPRRRRNKKAIGFLNIGAKPWAEIKIDGKSWPYQTPQAGIELPEGRHTIQLHNRETGVTKTTIVKIKADAYRTIMVDMRKKR